MNSRRSKYSQCVDRTCQIVRVRWGGRAHRRESYSVAGPIVELGGVGVKGQQSGCGERAMWTWFWYKFCC